MTSVEWLIERYPRLITILNPETIKEAKEIHEKEVVNAFDEGKFEGRFNGEKTGEQYYNETYKK